MQSIEASDAQLSFKLSIVSGQKESPLLSLLDDILKPLNNTYSNGQESNGQSSILERQSHSLEVLVSFSEKPIFDSFSTQRAKSIAADRSISISNRTNLFCSRVPMAFSKFPLFSGLHTDDFSTENR